MRWLAAPGIDTCAECLARNGKVYDLADAPNSPAHPDCKCVFVGEAGEATKGPEAFGVALESQASGASDAKMPSALVGDEREASKAGTTIRYRTDATDDECKRMVLPAVDEILEMARIRGIALTTPPSGIEFTTGNSAKLRGTGFFGNGRIVVVLKEDDKKWRDPSDIAFTFFHEYGHYRTTQLGWFAKRAGSHVDDSGLPYSSRRAIGQFLGTPPGGGVLLEQWLEISRYPTASERRSEVAARLFALSVVDPVGLDSARETLDKSIVRVLKDTVRLLR